VVIPHSQLPLLYAPVWSVLWFFCEIAALGYIAGPEVIPSRLKRLIGWNEEDDLHARGGWLRRGLGIVFLVGFPCATELIVIEEFGEQLKIANTAGAVLLVAHWVFVAAWTFYLVRVARRTG